MNKVCKLCTKDHNEDVGSHIFTESIIRTAINQEGEIRRSDKEIIFQAGRNKVGLKYFGSSVLPEKLESIIGETISDDLIEANKDNNPFINKDLVCRKCERRFNPVETKFFNNIYSKIHISASESFKKHKCNFITFEKEYLCAMLFCIINIWRASAAIYNSWKLTLKDEQYLGKYLNKVLTLDIETTLANAVKHEKEIEQFNFVLNYFIQEGERLSENIVIIDNSYQPYFILMNRLSIIFDFKELKSINNISILESIINKNIDCIINAPNTLNIGICSDEDRIKLIKRIGEREMDKIISDSDENFFEEHKKHLGIYPSIAAIKLYRYKIIEYIISVRLDIDFSIMDEIMIEAVKKIKSDVTR